MPPRYEPIVADMMADVALVQHSPWGGDGGAEETHYGWECLDYLLSAPDGTPQRPDVLYFNWGLHNTGNNTVPGQGGPIAECERKQNHLLFPPPPPPSFCTPPFVQVLYPSWHACTQLRHC
jgi:hypothetical protein